MPHNCRGGFLKRYNRRARKLGLVTIWEELPDEKVWQLGDF